MGGGGGWWSGGNEMNGVAVLEIERAEEGLCGWRWYGGRDGRDVDST